MIAVTALSGKRVALFGLGGSGLVTASALLAGGAEVVGWDDNPASVEKAQAQGVETQDLRTIDWSAIDLFVVAPGVPLTHPQPHWSVDLAKRSGVAVAGDIDLFFRQMEMENRCAPVVAITGTNGKSTTTALIAHVLSSAGREVQMGGNIGRAVLDLAPVADGEAAANQVYVVEVSSYQIDTAPNIKPHVGVLLNLTPDHLERHGTMQNYAGIKERLVAASDLAIISVDDEHCRAIAGRVDQAETPVERISKSFDGHVRYEDGALFHSEGHCLADLSKSGALRGVHNGQNAAAAWCACIALGLAPEEVQRGCDTFGGLAHRMEQVGRVGDTLFINDSKATNAEAASPALSSFAKVRWIAGGLAKSGGIEALADKFDRIEKAYLVGEAAGTFAAQLGDTIPYEISGTVEDAVNHAAADSARAGGEQVVLLSPAAASFDQFPNFERRGDAFRQAVEALNGFVSVG